MQLLWRWMKQEDENGSSSLVKESGRISTCCQRICLWRLKALEGLGFRAKWKETYVVPSLHLHDLQNKGRNVRITYYWSACLRKLLPWKSNNCYILRVCDCILVYVRRHTKCTRRICYRLWSVSLYHIALHYVMNNTFFRKEIYLISYVYLDFLYKLTWKISQSKNNWARYDHKCISVFM